MKKIGIVGGIAWRSTVEYYAEICRRSDELHRARRLPGPPSIPEIAIESLDLARALAWLGSEGDERSWERFDAYHRSALLRLEAGGAEVALIASNTPHHRWDSIVRGVRIPVISIVDAAAGEAVRLGAREVLLLGTALTMSSARLREAFAQHGIRAAGPSREATRATTLALIEDLQLGRSRGAGARLGRIARAAFAELFAGHPVVCLACTELPLAFPARRTQPSFQHAGVTYINTVAAHINATLESAGIL
ncbi:MAG TPA: aspartate/glutamate racemase family protein [Acidobacteriaceae bacterium]|jgi:aspartate racemase|nr:aspartate/glutamate racemase family protein [Acidobacteriaceae bacterium]